MKSSNYKFQKINFNLEGKTLKTAIAILSLLLFSCSKNDDNKPTTVTETPINVTVTTLAGSTAGDLVGTAAKFNGPALIALNSAGVLFVADFYNNKIKKIDQSGDVRIVLVSQPLLNPYGIATVGTDVLYVADSGNNRIKKITYGALQSTTTLTGTTAGDVEASFGLAKFNNPVGIAVSNDKIFVADSNNHKIKLLVFLPTLALGNVSNFVGSSQGDYNLVGTNASINTPYGIIADNNSNIYFADTKNNKIKKIDSSKQVSTVAGSTAGDADGNAAAAKFNQPQGLAVDGTGNIYVADTGNHKIKKISTSGVVTTIAGSTVGDQNGVGLSAKLNSPVGIVVDASGNLYISDFFNHKIKKITFN